MLPAPSVHFVTPQALTTSLVAEERAREAGLSKAREAVLDKAREAECKAMEAVLDQAREVNGEAKATPVAEAEVCQDQEGSPFPAHIHLRERLEQWKRMNASREVLLSISQGVLWDWQPPTFLPLYPTVRSREDLVRATHIVEEYLQVGALKEIPATSDIKFLIPWFILSKKNPLGGGKTPSHKRLSTTQRTLGSTKIPTGQHPTGFPSLKERNVRHKGGPQKRLLSFACGRICKTIPLHASRSKVLPMASSTIRAFKPSLSFSIIDENCAAKVERPRHFGMDLPGRHFSGLIQRKSFAKAQGNCTAGPNNFGTHRKLQKSVLNPSQQVDYFGFHLDFVEGKLKVPQHKLRTVKKELGKLVTHVSLTPRKMAAILGTIRSFLTAFPFLRAFTDQLVNFIKFQEQGGWDSPRPLSTDLQQQVREIKDILESWPGRTMGERPPTRHLHSDASGVGWGGVGHKRGHSTSRILARPARSSHKGQRIVGCHTNGPRFGKERRKSSPGGGQFSGLLLQKEKWGEKAPVQCLDATFLEMVLAEKHHRGGKSFEKSRHASRWPFSTSSGHRGLHVGKKRVLKTFKSICSTYSTRFGHVCKPWKPPAVPLGSSSPPPRGLGIQCSGSSIGKRLFLLVKPPLDLNSEVAPQIEDSTLGSMSNGSALLGWKFMVASTSQTASEGNPSNFNSTQVGSFHKLPGREDATYKVAPSLCDVIRGLMERKQMSPESVKEYLSQLPSLQRYGNAFRCLWAFAVQRKFHVPELTVDQVAGLLLQMNAINPHQARHAYSAVLLIPGFSPLRFSPLLARAKKAWNAHQAKYSSFWDAD